MLEKTNEFDVSYSDFVCTRSSEYFEQEKTTVVDRENSELFGSVDFLINVVEKKDKTDEDDEDENISNEKSEPKLVTEYIKTLVNGDGFGKKFSYRDIVIIARRKTNFGKLIDCFQKNDIPYMLYKGKGYYEIQEILDIISFLKFLHNQNDDVAFASILRSPYFSFNDSDLLVISTSYGNSFWEKFNNTYSDLSGTTNKVFYKIEDEQKRFESIFNRAYEIIKEILSMSVRMPLPMLIQKILNKCSWHGTLAGNPAKLQVSANMEKFIAKARDFRRKRL